MDPNLLVLTFGSGFGSSGSGFGSSGSGFGSSCKDSIGSETLVGAFSSSNISVDDFGVKRETWRSSLLSKYQKSFTLYGSVALLWHNEKNKC